MSLASILLSLIASSFSIAATVPQIYKIIQHASTKDLSLCCFLMHCIGGILWCLYGIVTEAYILAIEAAFVAFLNLIVVIHILEISHTRPTTRREAASPF
jgi:uncharacterized protein with PQ loop repeat